MPTPLRWRCAIAPEPTALRLRKETRLPLDLPAPTTDDFWDDQDGNLIGTAYTLAAKTIGTLAVGVFDNTTDPAPAFTAVSGATVEVLNFFKDTGTPSTSNLICFFDTATGLPLTPNGGDVNVTFNGSGIFKV